MVITLCICIGIQITAGRHSDVTFIGTAILSRIVSLYLRIRYTYLFLTVLIYLPITHINICTKVI